MPDGWWYECTVSYNLWVASEYIQIGLALNPFGYSLLTEKFPVDYNLTPEYDKVGANEAQTVVICITVIVSVFAVLFISLMSPSR